MHDLVKALLATIILTLAAINPAQAQNKGGVLLPSAARTATSVTSSDVINSAGASVVVVLDVTAYTSGTLTLTIQGKDPASGKYYTLLTGAAVNSISTNVYKIGPGLPVTANVSANDLVPVAWRISIAGASTPIATYSAGYSVVSQ